MIAPPPLRALFANKDGTVGNEWFKWFVSIRDRMNGPFELQSYALADVPAAENYTGFMIYVTDESGGAVPAFSDGTDWRRVTDRSVIS